MQRTKARGTRSTAPVRLTRSANVASGWPPSRATYRARISSETHPTGGCSSAGIETPPVAVRRGRRARELGESWREAG